MVLAPCAVAVLAVALSAAPPAVPAKKSALESARAALADAAFEKALALAEAGLKGAASDAERRDLHLLRGECLHALRRSAALREALDRAIEADAAAEYDAASTNPQLLDALAQARVRASGRVSVGAPPIDAPVPEVALDGKVLGPAPTESPAPAGRHQLTFRWPGGDAVDVPVLVRKGAATAVPVPAPPAPPPPVEVSKPLPPPPPPPAAAPAFRWPWIPVAGGGAALVAGVVCLASAAGTWQALTGGDGTSTLQLDAAGARALAAQGQAVQGAGIALTAVGAVAAGFGVVALATGLDRPRVAFAPLPGGGALVVGGALPW